MTELRISLLDEPLTRPLLDPSAWPGFSVELHRATSVDATSRAMQERTFDVAEMSFATFLRARFVDGLPLVALPAFTGRRFLQSQTGVAVGSKLRGAGELPGCRIAVPQYWMTSSVWHRSVLRSFYGVAPAALTWVTTGRERFRQEPVGVRVEHCEDGRSPAELVRDGDADVLLAPRTRPAGLMPLFADEAAEQERYYRETGVFPIMHLVVLDAERASAHPDLIPAVWQALVTARRSALPGPGIAGLRPEQAARAFNGDPWAYGLHPNRTSIQALLDAAVADGLLSSQPGLDEVVLSDPKSADC